MNEPEVDEQQAALVKRYNERIDRANNDPLQKARLARNKRLRLYVQGRQDETPTKDKEEVRANLVLGILQTVLPQYYAKDPELDVRPDEQVNTDYYEALTTFCDTARIVLNRVFIRNAKLKARITRSIGSAMTNGVAWMKVTYQRDYWTDPMTRNRIQDAQDNVAKLKALETKAADGTSDQTTVQAQTEQLTASLQEQTEQLIAEGLVIDFVIDDDILLLDESLTTFGEYPQSRAIGHLIWMTTEEFETRFGKKPTGQQYASKLAEDKRQASANEPSYVKVYEIWDREMQSIVTIEYGAKGWAREPYRPMRQAKRWYPFFALYWNEVDGQLYPVSDVEQWTSLQDEYNRMRTQLVIARRENKPVRVGRKGGSITDEDYRRIANREAGDIVLIETNGSQLPLQDELVQMPPIPIDPTAYDATPILRDMEQVSGISDASRASINKAKTATEAEIQSMGMQSRTAYRQDMIEDLIADMAEAAFQVLLQEMTIEQVAQIAGDSAVWPSMPREEIYGMVRVGVRAGSTGKPNQNQEREQWVQIAPQLLQFISQVGQARQMGMVAEAEALIELLRETLKRFDERIDIDKFFQQQPMMQGSMPGMQPGQPMQPGMPGQSMQPPAGQMQGQMPGLPAIQPGATPDQMGGELQQWLAGIMDNARQGAVSELEQSPEQQMTTALVTGQQQTGEALTQMGGSLMTMMEQFGQVFASIMAQQQQTMQQMQQQAAVSQQQAQMSAQQMAELAASIQQLAAVQAAPKEAFYGPDGRVAGVRPLLS